MSDVLLLNANAMPISIIPLSVIPWQKAMRLLFTDKVKVLKEYDNWVVRSQHFEMKVPSIIIMSEQVKYVKTVEYSRSNIFLRDNFTCQLQITSRCKERGGKDNVADLTLDHVVPRSHGGKTSWTNVCTSCKACNSLKGSDASIVPKVRPKTPSYYDILAKRKTLPIRIKDADWAYYISWPDHLITVLPQPKGPDPISGDDEFILDED
jgi:5-methylcytosine-specific restriction endonuclease McrA